MYTFIDMESEIEIINLKKSFKSGDEEIVIINELSLSLNKGDKTVIMGNSGSGKTTLLNMLAALEKPDEGSIKVGEYQVDSLKEKQINEYRNKKIGFVFQFHYLLEDFTTLENIMFPSLLAGLSFIEAKSRASELLNEVGLVNRAKHYPSTLSGGERQRISLARALINNPSVLLADEPTGSLDEKNSNNVKDMLLKMVENHKTTLILVSHDKHFLDIAENNFSLEMGHLVKL